MEGISLFYVRSLAEMSLRFAGNKQRPVSQAGALERIILWVM